MYSYYESVKVTENQLEVLRNAVADYFYARQEYVCLAKKIKENFGFYLNSVPLEIRGEYERYDERDTCKWEIISALCKLLGFDIEDAFAAIKAIERYEKHGGKYDRCVHFNYRNCGSFCRALSSGREDSKMFPYECYQSTGRKVNF